VEKTVFAHTWDRILQLLLNKLYQVLDTLSWSCPEDQAVPCIHEMRIPLWSIKLAEHIIKDPTWKFGRKDFLLLLLVPGSTMQVVTLLD